MISFNGNILYNLSTWWGNLIYKDGVQNGISARYEKSS